MTFFESVLMVAFVTIIFTLTILICGYGLAWAMNDDIDEDYPFNK